MTYHTAAFTSLNETESTTLPCYENVIQHFKIVNDLALRSFDVSKHHATLPSVMQRCQASCNVAKRHITLLDAIQQLFTVQRML